MGPNADPGGMVFQLRNYMSGGRCAGAEWSKPLGGFSLTNQQHHIKTEARKDERSPQVCHYSARLAFIIVKAVVVLS